jgi:hypothetical protein
MIEREILYTKRYAFQLLVCIFGIVKVYYISSQKVAQYIADRAKCSQMIANKDLKWRVRWGECESFAEFEVWPPLFLWRKALSKHFWIVRPGLLEDRHLSLKLLHCKIPLYSKCLKALMTRLLKNIRCKGHHSAWYERIKNWYQIFFKPEIWKISCEVIRWLLENIILKTKLVFV